MITVITNHFLSNNSYTNNNTECMHGNNKQLLDEVEHDIMNYQRHGLCFIIHFSHNSSEAFCHFVSEENTPRGLVTRQMMNLTR